MKRIALLLGVYFSCTVAGTTPHVQNRLQLPEKIYAVPMTMKTMFTSGKRLSISEIRPGSCVNRTGCIRLHPVISRPGIVIMPG